MNLRALARDARALADYVPTMDAAGLTALIEAIRHLHGLEATWLESVPVVETHEGQTVWAGEVQVSLWSTRRPAGSRRVVPRDGRGKRRFHAVLGVAPVTGAEMAVRAAVLVESE